MDSPVAATLTYLIQAFGGNLGAGVIALSIGVRLGLFPLTLWLARRNLRRQAITRELQPAIEALKKRFEKNPERLVSEVGKLYRAHGISVFDLPTLLGGFLQLPVFGMLYGAIRSSITGPSVFLWIKNLAAPDLLLTSLVLVLTAVSAYLAPGLAEHARTTLTVIQVIITCLIIWKLAAALGLYWAASGFVGLLQTLWLRYRPVSIAKAC
jgi:YidC/Oxa1 family membrane protein insertase